MTYALVFLFFTLVVYLMHRIAHNVGLHSHADHHRYVNKYPDRLGWHWTNLFLYNDSWESTVDLWITEVIPCIIISLFAGFWLFAVYYVWAAFVQERLEHNANIDLYPFLTSGKWHLEHHKDASCNYGIFLPIWDIIFGTNKRGN